MSSLRIRKLTSKAQTMYEERIAEFHTQLDQQVKSLEQVRDKNIGTHSSTQEIKAIEEHVFSEFAKFQRIAKDFELYLVNQRTEESLEENDRLQENIRQITHLVDEICAKFAQLLGRRTATSVSSSCTSDSVKKLARASGLQARLQFAIKEAELKKAKAALEEQELIAAASAARRKNDLEADMILLREQREAAEAKAEAEVLEGQTEHGSVLIPVPQENSLTRTANFVQSSNPMNTDTTPTTFPAPMTDNTTSRLNPAAPVYSAVSNNMNQFSQFLLKKEILLSRFTHFDDRPENYQTWKHSFRSIVAEIQLTDFETVDLLVKWLGPSSSNQAKTIRAANVYDPKQALKQIWDRLEERYGYPEMVEQSIRQKLTNFPKIGAKDNKKLFELCDILAEIESLKADPKFQTMFSHYDCSIGVSPIVVKLPHQLQERWTQEASKYKACYDVPYPPFSVFSEYVRRQSRIRNDPSFNYESFTSSPSGVSSGASANKKSVLKAAKLSVSSQNISSENRCPIHKSRHSLSECNTFVCKSNDEKIRVLRDLKLCFKCFANDHVSKICQRNIQCDKCGKRHATVMHFDGGEPSQPLSTQFKPKEERQSDQAKNQFAVSSKCTDICGLKGVSSCAKVVLVNVCLDSNRDKKLRTYAIIDDQSNRSLAKPDLFEHLNVNSPDHEYTINSCSGSVVTNGRFVHNCIVESVDQSVSYKVPGLIECADLPCCKDEICRPEQARHFAHLRDLPIPEVDANADILLLLGRDVTDAHHVFEQVTGSPGTPFAQRLSLGWVVIGELCLNTMHSQVVVNVNKINCLTNGRPSLFKPCESKISVTEYHDSSFQYDSVFESRPDDNKVSLSVDDREFLAIMKESFHVDQSNHMVAPLPFRFPRMRLPNNRDQALKRAHVLDLSLQRNAVKRQHCVEFMSKILDNGHAEVASDLKPNEECWFLPIFGVYHPRKPDQIRMVFDSSALFQGISLNSVLLQGPDLVNNLLGVLMRFRSDQVAVMADIEQMFYSFSVLEEHRNFLRFLWYLDNDSCKPIVEYRMCKHVFGNSPSPAIATYGLRRSVENSDSDVRHFVTNDFYVDDGLKSLPTADKAVDLLQRTRSELSKYGLHLHKISSNDPEVMKAFPQDELAKNLKDLDLEKSQLPQQRSLGISWDLCSDSFFFKLGPHDQPPTHRGILSTVNSMFDPIGFLAPVTLEGKLILRDVTASNVGWDDPIPDNLLDKWQAWTSSLHDLEQIRIPRTYFPGQNLSEMSNAKLHIFSDASEKAISAVAYLVGDLEVGKPIGFVSGKAKVAPANGHTIPRLELCAAVLAVELADAISDHLDIDSSSTRFYSDSKVTLGYINNRSRRFYTYVSNRVQRIRNSSSPEQWKFVRSELNPADVGSRGISADRLTCSAWLSGPHMLQNEVDDQPETFPLLDPDHDGELRPTVSTKATVVDDTSDFSKVNGLGTKRFERFSNWLRLVIALSTLKHVSQCYSKKSSCSSWHLCSDAKSVDLKHQVEKMIIKEVQQKTYYEEISSLKAGRPLRKQSTLFQLDPFIDGEGIIRVGGRLAKSALSDKEKHPVVLPGKHHVAKLLVSHYHESVKHQGRLLTEGAVRSAGFWIVGGKRLVSSLIYSCVICKRMRGKFESPKMSDLPYDRVQESKPFSHVGVDVFGPWTIVSRRTRGGQASSKRWAVLFTCLAIRAVHVEVIDEMTSSAFINALRRFTAIRGKVMVYRSDRGTNFVGATDSLGINAINVEDDLSKKYLYETDSVWIFNPPHSSHMGGSWERMIGIARRILESVLAEVKTLTHDVLTTLMAEVSAIMNARPIAAVSSDVTDPQVLSPSVLLTMKFACDQLPVADVNIKDLYKSHWKQVQFLAERFWHKWRRDYLQSLQPRRKWTDEKDNLEQGDVVLMKDSGVGRLRWPMGRVQRVFPSDDDRVRKVELCIVKDGKKSIFIRPVVELVKLV